MVSRSSLLLAGFVAVGASGCASIIGLDSGEPVDDGGIATSSSAALDDGGAANEDGSASVESDDAGGRDANAHDASGPAPCGPTTADCNGNASDGCESSLTSTQDCGRCGHACIGAQTCNAGNCCLPTHAICVRNEDCCSGSCGPGASGCHDKRGPG